jgi:hypothetical protein
MLGLRFTFRTADCTWNLQTGTPTPFTPNHWGMWKSPWPEARRATTRRALILRDPSCRSSACAGSRTCGRSPKLNATQGGPRQALQTTACAVPVPVVRPPPPHARVRCRVSRSNKTVHRFHDSPECPATILHVCVWTYLALEHTFWLKIPCGSKLPEPDIKDRIILVRGVR